MPVEQLKELVIEQLREVTDAELLEFFSKLLTLRQKRVTVTAD